MARVVLKLSPTADGDFTARKRISEDVQDAYEKLYDPGLTPWGLFERWIDEREPQVTAVDRWPGLFL